MREISLGASLAAAPLGQLAQTLGQLEAARADFLHFDLEDGHFIPSLGLGTRLLEEARELTRLPLDVHLLVTNPERWIPQAARMGAAAVTVHYEACDYPRRTLRQIKDLGLRSGLALNARTPVPSLEYLLPLLDLVNVQSTEPEMPDWPFLPEILEKVGRIAAMAAELRPELSICVDGGLDSSTLPQAVAAGADWLVVGRGVFQGGVIPENLARLRAAAQEGLKRRSATA
jgi:ribulose-phosphate 3-epimerase